MDLTGKTPEEIQELVNDQETQLAAAAELIAEKDELIASLNEVIANAKTETKADVNAGKAAATVPVKAIKIDGKKYKWTKGKFRLMGDVNYYTAEQASKDEDVLKKILAIPGQDLLVEQQ